jgi:hypothetical protein
MKQENKEIIDIDKCARDLLASNTIQTCQKVNNKVLKLMAYKMFNNLTGEERELIITQAWIFYNENKIEDGEDTNVALED